MYEKFELTSESLARIEIHKVYEPLQPYFLMEVCRAFKVSLFIDVGANVGPYTLLMASLPAVNKVHSFEPSPKAFEHLQSNIVANKLVQRVVLHKKAASSNIHAARFGIANDLSGTNSIVDTSIHSLQSFSSQIDVDCVTLDEVVKESGRVIGLKIDTEGHDLEVLMGAKSILTNNRCILQIEGYDDTAAEIMELLQPLGYRRIIKFGPDYYFSNLPEFQFPETVLNLVEISISTMIEERISQPSAKPSSPAARMNFGGIFTLELNGALGSYARYIRSRLRGRGGK
ncbi:FkbM family methyltransferase [Labrys monachus]|uniref:FkbM family methyltransferase n=1 Tax=Labrys monachus TaxID=217067 RepID=A0ABU0FJL3_9HYPH|nr:FkbM family methyltransferase [Labrys monachus]MDQ0394795.1 FkbM family methyltransferase [Labrys monachus]